METKLIESSNGPHNWGKFMVARFDKDEWKRRSEVAENDYSLLGQIGWGPEHIMVFDLQTGEGALFSPHGLAGADLEKHRIWVCPLFEPFLEWLYKQDLSDFDKLPSHIDLPDVPFQWHGYRRGGPEEARLGELGGKEFKEYQEVLIGLEKSLGDTGVLEDEVYQNMREQFMSLTENVFLIDVTAAITGLECYLVGYLQGKGIDWQKLRDEGRMRTQVEKWMPKVELEEDKKDHNLELVGSEPNVLAQCTICERMGKIVDDPEYAKVIFLKFYPSCSGKKEED